MPITSPDQDAGFDIDSALGESYYEGRKELEERYTNEIIEVIRSAIKNRFCQGDRPARRDAHTFDTGCVSAIFRIDPDLHPELRQGVLVPGREYPAWIRFSNGNFVRTSPRSPDARGMAIKLMDVPGAKMLDDEKFTQDFILISHPAFFVNDLRIYKATLERFLRGSFWSQWASAPLQLRSLRAIAIAFRVNARFILNPLFIQYWSMTPYRLGIDPLRKLAVKYTAKPSQDVKKTVYDDLASYFARGFSLKKQMNDRLAMSEEARFDFYVQRYVDDRTPIEDATVAWSEAISKPEHVAQIVIPPQDIMSAARGDFCEHLSFNPWHGLPEHKPLGLVNRVRRRIYFEISEYRHGLNEVPRTEPTGNERFFSC